MEPEKKKARKKRFKTPLQISFGNRVATERVKTKITQMDFGAKFDMSRQTIGEIENGYMNVSLATIEKISVALNIPISELMENVGSVKKSKKKSDDTTPRPT